MAQKILVVDDDTYIRELYEEVLRDEGFEIDSAEDGEQALEKLLQGGYDMTLLDIMMPKLDGLGVLEGLKKQENKVKNGPILILSNLGHDPAVEKAIANGAIAYLIKADMTPDQVVENVKKYLPQEQVAVT